MTDNKISNSININKSNYKILKLITIVLSILIVVCIVFLIFGFVDKLEKLSKSKDDKKQALEKQYTLFYPNESQIISVDSYGNENILIRFQQNGKNKLIIVDLKSKKILTNIHLKKSNEWKIQ